MSEEMQNPVEAMVMPLITMVENSLPDIEPKESITILLIKMLKKINLPPLYARVVKKVVINKVEENPEAAIRLLKDLNNDLNRYFN